MFTDTVAAGMRHVLCLGLFVSVTACAVSEEEVQHSREGDTLAPPPQCPNRP